MSRGAPAHTPGWASSPHLLGESPWCTLWPAEQEGPPQPQPVRLGEGGADVAGGFELVTVPCSPAGSEAHTPSPALETQGQELLKPACVPSIVSSRQARLGSSSIRQAWAEGSSEPGRDGRLSSGEQGSRCVSHSAMCQTRSSWESEESKCFLSKGKEDEPSHLGSLRGGVGGIGRNSAMQWLQPVCCLFSRQVN